MLILSRKQGEKIIVGEEIEITVSKISGGRVTIGVAAPPHVNIRRAEIDPLPKADVQNTGQDACS